jgi:hypothetical protein
MGKNQDPGYGIHIPDPQHCVKYVMIVAADPKLFVVDPDHT